MGKASKYIPRNSFQGFSVKDIKEFSKSKKMEIHLIKKESRHLCCPMNWGLRRAVILSGLALLSFAFGEKRGIVQPVKRFPLSDIPSYVELGSRSPPGTTKCQWISMATISNSYAVDEVYAVTTLQQKKGGETRDDPF